MWWCKCKLSTGKWQREPVECPFKFIQSFSIVQFPTRTYKNSISAIDNIFIDTTKVDTYEVIPVINWLSDHDAQIINLNTLYNNKSHGYQTYFRWNINKYTMAEFQNSLSYESWDQVFDGDDVNKIFNSLWTLT